MKGKLLSVLWVCNVVSVKYYMAWPQFVTLKSCRSLLSLTFEYIEYDISKMVSYWMLHLVFSYKRIEGALIEWHVTWKNDNTNGTRGSLSYDIWSFTAPYRVAAICHGLIKLRPFEFSEPSVSIRNEPPNSTPAIDPWTHHFASRFTRHVSDCSFTELSDSLLSRFTSRLKELWALSTSELISWTRM